MMRLRAISSPRLAVFLGLTGLGLVGGLTLVGAASQRQVGEQATVDPGTEPGRSTASIADSLGNPPTATSLPMNQIRPSSSIGRGNPLWAIPLTSLTATQERPIFSPSRRPPPAVVELPSIKSQPPPPVIARPSRPLLALVGTIIGDSEGLAIFVDEATRGIVRLKTGESHSGWILRLVAKREATLQKEGEIAIFPLANPSTK